MSDGSLPPLPPRRGAMGAEWVILAFVVLSIVLLLLIPLRVADRNEALRSRMDDVVDPARERVTEIQYNLAREMGALRGYLLTGDAGFLERHAAIRERITGDTDALSDLAPALGDEALDAFIDLRVRIDLWHRLPGLASRDPGGESIGAAATEQRQYDAALEAAARLDAAVAEVGRVLREDLRAQDRVALRYTFLLAFLALASAAALAWLGVRLRRLAEEAGRQRRDAQEALEETRRSVDARHRLIRGITHDVKNPLGAADGYAELLALGLRGPLAPAQEETVRSIRRSIASAVHTINDLLALSEVESPRLELRETDVALRSLVRDVVDAHSGVAEASGRRLVVDEGGPDPTVRTDPRRVEQVLANLLTNAIKYSTPGGTVRVALTEPPDGEPETVGITVADGGPGIPEAELEHIFDEFQRLSHGTPGHGLGLTISRTVAHRLGGDLTVVSRPGEGSAFTLRLPGRRDPGPPPTRPGKETDGAPATG